MLEEYKITPEGEIPRRWFKDDQLDIILWILPNHKFKFELTYNHKVDNRLEQRVIKYSPIGGLRHFLVAEEHHSLPTPKLLLGRNYLMPLQWLAMYLLHQKGKLPNDAESFIYEIMAQID